MTTEMAFNAIPEFGNSKVPGLIEVPEGQVASGDIEAVFISRGFSVCSGIVLRNELNLKFGFIHLYPGEEIIELYTSDMNPLIGADAIIIEGSDSRHKGRLLQQIGETFQLNYQKPLEVDTSIGLLRNRQFHLVYRPVSNEIVVARTSHEDYLTFNAF